MAEGAAENESLQGTRKGTTKDGRGRDWTMGKGEGIAAT